MMMTMMMKTTVIAKQMMTNKMRIKKDIHFEIHIQVTFLSSMTELNILNAIGLNFINSPRRSKLLWRISLGLISELPMWSTRCWNTSKQAILDLLLLMMMLMTTTTLLTLMTITTWKMILMMLSVILKIMILYWVKSLFH